jgi:hypothetical protein
MISLLFWITAKSYVYNNGANECQHNFAPTMPAIRWGAREGISMGNMKYFYFGFGGFIGFVCGMVIQMLMYAVERSGNPILTRMGRGDYGVIGKGLLVLYEGLPYMGIVLGVVLVRTMFRKDIDKEGSG